MKITRRRQEFLDKLVGLFQQTGLPVHYATVGQALRVSKWTAYDILRELEKGGFLRAEYAVSREEKNPGRSMVMFLPTASALRLFSAEAGKATPAEEWSAVKEKLFGLFDNMKSMGTKKVIDHLLEEMSRIEVPVTFSAYTIALLITYLKHLGSRSANVLRCLLTLPAKPELTLIFFAGTVVGTMTKNMMDAINGKLIPLVRRFQQHLAECDAGEKKLLLGFLNEALERTM
jgi:DNA-binding Lrp family transcriptional regulator